MAKTAIKLRDLESKIGQEVGVSPWVEILQERIDKFAEATGDFQWIHVDPERAAQTPFGGTIAHGLFTLSLGPKFSYEVIDLQGFAFGVNYGYGRVRFPAPMHVGARVRMRATLTSVEEVAGGVQFTITQTYEREGTEKPVCVAESLARAFTG